MSNNAIINFLFNSQGAMREIDNFKNRFTQTVDAISNSSIGKFAAIGAGLASAFSIKAFYDHTKAVRDLHDVYNDLPLDEISLFSNRLRLLGGTEQEAIDFLHKMQDSLVEFKTTGKGILSEVLPPLGINLNEIKNATDLIDKLHEAMASSKLSETGFNKIITSMGLSNTASLNRFFRQDSASYLKNYETAQKEMATITDNSVNHLNKFQEALARLQGAFEKVGYALLEANLSGLIEKLVEWVNKFNALEPDTKERIIKTVAALILLAPALKLASEAFNIISGTTKTFASALKLLKFVPILLPLALITGIVYSLTTNFGGLSDALEKFGDKWDEWVRSLEGSHPQIAKLLDTLHTIGAIMTSPLDAAQLLMDGKDVTWQNIRDLEKQREQEGGNKYENSMLSEVKEDIKSGEIGKNLKNLFGWLINGESTDDKISNFNKKMAEITAQKDINKTINVTVNMNNNIKTDNPKEFADRIASPINQNLTNLALQQ